MCDSDVTLTQPVIVCDFSITSVKEITFPKMVANCCRFLCYFCRISRQNQKAMFDHLSYLLENSSVGLGKSIGFLWFFYFTVMSSLVLLHSLLDLYWQLSSA